MEKIIDCRGLACPLPVVNAKKASEELHAGDVLTVKVDNEIAVKRAELVEMIQSDIMDDYNASMMGKTLEILVDGYDEELEQFYGRTYADSPEIDSRVWIASQDALVEGTFVKVCIDGVIDGELSGFLMEE